MQIVGDVGLAITRYLQVTWANCKPRSEGPERNGILEISHYPFPNLTLTVVRFVSFPPVVNRCSFYKNSWPKWFSITQIDIPRPNFWTFPPVPFLVHLPRLDTCKFSFGNLQNGKNTSTSCRNHLSCTSHLKCLSTGDKTNNGFDISSTFRFFVRLVKIESIIIIY